MTSDPTCPHGSIYCPDCDEASDFVAVGMCPSCQERKPLAAHGAACSACVAAVAEGVRSDEKSNPNTGPSVVHDFGCTHDPCHCAPMTSEPTCPSGCPLHPCPHCCPQSACPGRPDDQ